MWDALEAAGVPQVKGVWKMSGGGTRFINVIAIKQQCIPATPRWRAWSPPAAAPAPT